jgi:hypothetical protein
LHGSSDRLAGLGGEPAGHGGVLGLDRGIPGGEGPAGVHGLPMPRRSVVGGRLVGDVVDRLAAQVVGHHGVPSVLVAVPGSSAARRDDCDGSGSGAG